VDFATTENAGDHTAIVAFGLDPNSDIFVLDVWRRQSAPDVSIGALLDMVRDWKPQCVVTESGQIKNALGPFLREEMNRRKLWVPIETIPSRHAKEIRAQAIVGRAAVRGLYLPAHADWLSDFKAEVLGFPSTRWDDCVDCLSLFGQLLSRLVPGQATPEKAKPLVRSTSPELCTVTLDHLWAELDRQHKRGFARIK
jgi:predicted phage terminase large subunit-like protein